MKPLTLVTMTCLMLLMLMGCNQADSTQDTTPVTPDTDNTSFDDVFTDINDAAFTTWEADAIEEAGNYLRLARIDVVDENGFDHQGVVIVCEGIEDFTRAYHTYLNQLMERYGDDMGIIAGYRNAAVNGDRTYRDTDVDFFCIQDVVFLDYDGIKRTGVVIALDGSDAYVGKEDSLHSDFTDAYW